MSDPFPFTVPAEACPSAWLEEMQPRALLAEGAGPANRTALFDALARAGITAVIVEFDGAGDSGQIESVTAHAGETPVDLPADTVTIGEPNRAGTGLDHRACPLAEAIETLAYDLLAGTHGGWENNDGAFGTFTFDVADRSIRLDHHERVMESVHSEHAF